MDDNSAEWVDGSPRRADLEGEKEKTLLEPAEQELVGVRAICSPSDAANWQGSTHLSHRPYSFVGAAIV